MPRTVGRSERSLWLGLGDAWTMVSDLLAAVAVWGAIGFGVDQWLDTYPVFMIAGALLGHGTGIYMVIRRAGQMSSRAQAEKELRNRS